MNVATDTDLSPEEKETVIQWSKAEDSALVHSEMPAVVRWLLQNPNADIQHTRTKDDQIVAAQARLSVGMLKLSGSPRKSTTPSSVVGKLPEGSDDG